MSCASYSSGYDRHIIPSISCDTQAAGQHSANTFSLKDCIDVLRHVWEQVVGDVRHDVSRQLVQTNTSQRSHHCVVLAVLDVLCTLIIAFPW